MTLEYGPPWMFNVNLLPFSRDYSYYDQVPIWAFSDFSYARKNYLIYADPPDPEIWWILRTTSDLIAFDGVPPLVGTSLPDTSYHFTCGDLDTNEKFILASFDHVNTVDPDAPWDIAGQAGDRRIYSGAVVYIEENISNDTFVYYKVPKLKLSNACLYTLSPYPETVVSEGEYVTVGTGEPISGFGWGDIDFAGSDPAWAALFDNPTHQVEFSFVSPSIVNQYYYGDYESDLVLEPASVQRKVRYSYGSANPNYLDATADCDMVLNVVSGNYYHQDIIHTDCVNCMTAKFYEAPTGNFPAGLHKICEQAYWQSGTIFNDVTANITFNFDSIEGIETPQNIRLLRRNLGFGNNWSDTNASVVSLDPLVLSVSGYNIMGQYCLASTGGNSFGLPAPQNVVISYSPSEVRAQLWWDTVPGALFYNVYTSDDPDTPWELWQHLIQLPDPINAFDTSAYPAKKFFYITAEK